MPLKVKRCAARRQETIHQPKVAVRVVGRVVDHHEVRLRRCLKCDRADCVVGINIGIDDKERPIAHARP